MGLLDPDDSEAHDRFDLHLSPFGTDELTDGYILRTPIDVPVHPLAVVVDLLKHVLLHMLRGSGVYSTRFETICFRIHPFSYILISF